MWKGLLVSTTIIICGIISTGKISDFFSIPGLQISKDVIGSSNDQIEFKAFAQSERILSLQEV